MVTTHLAAITMDFTIELSESEEELEELDHQRPGFDYRPETKHVYI
jgi:hypothetical protein